MFLNYNEILQLIQINIEKDNNIILEPLSCIFRMVLYNFKPDGTKISILNNSIIYDEYNYYQGIIRTFNGAKRDDLHNLYNPFIKSIEWFPIKNNEQMKYFYQKCYDGLLKLKNSYEKESIIHHTLTHYCTLFKNVLSDNKLNDEIILNNDENDKESPLLNELKNIWNKKELNIIYQTLNYLEDTSDEEEKIVYLKNIDDIISMKEKKVHEYIQKYSTRYN